MSHRLSRGTFADARLSFAAAFLVAACGGGTSNRLGDAATDGSNRTASADADAATGPETAAASSDGPDLTDAANGADGTQRPEAAGADAIDFSGDAEATCVLPTTPSPSCNLLMPEGALVASTCSTAPAPAPHVEPW